MVSPPTSSGPPTVNALAKTLSELAGSTEVGAERAAQLAVKLARHLQQRGQELQTPQEKRQQTELERMMQSEQDKATLTQLTDQAFRSSSTRRAANQLTHILDVQGVPRFFSVLDRAMLKGFQSFGSYLPGVSMPMVRDKMREETANVILPAEHELLGAHLDERRRSGLRMNVNYLGEALLGEEDAKRRLKAYLAALQLEEIECISVKISTIYSQISTLAHEASVRELCDRLELLYRAAAKSRFRRADGSEVAKFVYLDMEEYRDLAITLDAFMRTLDRPGLEQVNAGIALQAYLPDSFAAQQRIDEWARKRLKAGGSPVTIRIVKGANMEMERVEASIAGWPQAPYTRKVETDANFKRMLHQGLEPGNIAAVRLGIASHNLFDLSYALVLGSQRGVLPQMQLEMLEGMANHQRRALCELTGSMLLYAPATRRQDFTNAIGYLLRRLDENTGPDNFLRHAFKLQVDSDEWRQLERDFLDSFALMDELSTEPRRKQNRSESIDEPATVLASTADFVNEPDTDWALADNRRWAERIVARWKCRTGDDALLIPLTVAGERVTAERAMRECTDPSRPGTVVGRYHEANAEDVARALACAVDDPTGWRRMPESERAQVLARVAHELRRGRGDLLGAAMADGGKILSESDPEVSEAIDFVEYYAVTARELRGLDTVDATPKGVVVVVSPWNFPIAIPCGGVASALAAGNCVLLKPASHTVLVAHELCKCFWRAGVPEQVLQLLPCAGATVGSELVADAQVNAVILTGGTSTALRMLRARPDLDLLAETGGKNATIVTAMSDREQTIKHVLHSAFSHSGQKCSATSLLILEAEVYDDPEFEQTLCDAVRSLKVGSAWELDTRVGPLITPPQGELERGLKELEDGERWAVMPRQRDDNPQLYTPAVKWGTRPGSFTHMTELFGPVLAVMRADDLAHAIELTNQTGYGLTSGLESLDDREQRLWKDGIAAGNLYLNRVTTGAVVERQPFGGFGKSAFGPGIKAGGPNYVAQLMSWSDHQSGEPAPSASVHDRDVEALRRELVKLCDLDTDLSPEGVELAELARVLHAISSYDARYQSEFGRSHDPVRLVGQDNHRRYLPVAELRVRVHPSDSAFELFARVCAAKTVGCHITVSTPPRLQTPELGLLDRLTESWGAAIEFIEETDQELVAAIAARQLDRLRYAAPGRAARHVLEAVGDSGVYLAQAPVLIEGRIELLWYLREQSISFDYHRYGNLGARSNEARRPVS